MTDKRPRYRGYIQAEEIRPLGPYKYAAKLVGLKRLGDDNRLVPVTGGPHHEHWGETRDAAIEQARAEAERWIEEQGGIAELT